MVIKLTFKSHFKIKKINKNSNKKQFNNPKTIFVKNMVVFLLFNKLFFENCTTTILFTKTTTNNISLLKAPSRHKKFFHQVFQENFFLKIFFRCLYYKLNSLVDFKKINLNTNIISIKIFKKLFLIFSKIGSNVLTQTKFSFSSSFKNPNLFLYISNKLKRINLK